MDASTEQKQQYLRVQILETGYDPEDFIEFMSTYAAIQNPTIEHMTLPQLVKIVAEYKQQVKRRNLQAEAQQNIKNQQKAEPQKSGKKIFVPERVKLLQQKKSKIEYDRYGTFDYEMKGTVNCIDSQKIIKVDKIQINIPQMETKQTQGYLFGLGARTQYYYLIRSNLMKGTVKRLSQDFDWLNSTLLRLYPHMLLPELQPVRKDIKDPYVKRQKQIQQYLQHLCEKRFLTFSYVFVDFLTLSSQKMQKYKKSYDSMGFAKGVSLMKTQQGFVQVDLSNRTRELYTCSKQFSKKTAQIHDSLTLAINKMLDSYRVAIADTYAVVDLFAQLHDIFAQVGNKFPQLKKEQYNDTLVNLNNLFLGIGDNLKNIADTIEDNTKDYFRFYNGLDKNLSKIQKIVKQAQSEYIQFKNTLQRKKQRVIADPTKWDLQNRQIDTKKLSKDQLMKLILPKQVLAQNELKSWYAFNLKNYQNEFNTYLRFITKRYQKVFKNMAVQLLADDKGYLQSITKFISENRKSQTQGKSPQVIHKNSQNP